MNTFNGKSEGLANTWESLFMNNYGAPSVTLVRGEGSKVWDDNDFDYIDLLGGIAVNAIGAGNSKFVEAVSRQLASLTHTSNLYANVPAMDLAAKLIALTEWENGSVFFCNSGAEANEAAFKLSRLTGKTQVVVVEGSFHGRTMGALALTAQPAKQIPFLPLPGDVVVVARDDLSQLRAAVGPETAAVFMEPIQGESGIHPLSHDFLREARTLTRENNALLIFDEVQSGMGRTGRWWAHQRSGVQPDAMTLAKGLGGGLPIGALITAGDASELFTPGSHGSTFGGNPVVAAGALAVIKVIEGEGLLKRAEILGERFMQELVTRSHGQVSHVRGEGLLLAAVLTTPRAKDFEIEARHHGLLVNAVSLDAIRIAPALSLTDIEFTEAIIRWENAVLAFIESGQIT